MTRPSSDLPALVGGTPIRPQGPPDWPPADDEVRQALDAAFRDGSWGKYHGGHVARLEERLAQYHGVDFGLTCGSGTFAVELALRALKIGPGDEVILAAYDFPGNFLAVHAVGARPVLVDATPGNWNLDPDQLSAAVGPATRAVIASHLHGGAVPMARLMDVAREHGLKVVEDAAQAPGSIVQGRRAGTWGDVGVISFGGSKLLSAGRGGAILTRDAQILQRARVAAFRGNLVCPLSELQAAVLLPQLEKLDERNRRRARNVQHLGDLLGDLPGLRPFPLPESGDLAGYYKLGFQFDAERFGLPRQRFVAAMRAEGIALDVGFSALHVGRSQSRFRPVGELAEATRAHHGCVILHHPVLLGESADIAEIAAAAHKIASHAATLAGV